ncbi:MAG: aryl-sulfate sulfotransferase [Candidatus Sulfotelmatobacter sp.]
MTIASLGCATSNYIPYETGVSPTANPLVAQYSVRHYQPGFSAWVEFGTDTTYGRQTSEVSDSASAPGGAVVNVLVAGMLPQTTYHMRAHIDTPSGSWVDTDHTFTTGALPGPVTSQPASPASGLHFPAITATLPTPGLTPAPGVELLSLTSVTAQAVAVDLQGNVIWYCPTNAEPVKLLPNGHFIIVEGTHIEEVDLACNVIRDVSYTQINQSLQANGASFSIPAPLGIPGGNPFHHDVLVLPNGDWIALCQIEKAYTDLPDHPGSTNVVGDALVDIDLNGTVVWTWSAFDHLDPNRNLMGWPDWTHTNAIVYTADGNLLLSMRHQSWIIKLDYQNGTGSGDVLWKLGNEGDFTLRSADSSQWFYGQHYPTIIGVDGSKTTLAVYDDGNIREGSDQVLCGQPPAPSCYTRATIYELDEQGFTANLVWQDLPGFFSFWGGSIDSLDNGNRVDVEFASSAPSTYSGSQILEVTYSLTDPPQVVWQMDIAGVGAYRGYRIPSLYPGVKWAK